MALDNQKKVSKKIEIFFEKEKQNIEKGKYRTTAVLFQKTLKSVYRLDPFEKGVTYDQRKRVHQVLKAFSTVVHLLGRKGLFIPFESWKKVEPDLFIDRDFEKVTDLYTIHMDNIKNSEVLIEETVEKQTLNLTNKNYSVIQLEFSF